MSQVALVTGSSRGIGLATAEALLREGFAVAVNAPIEDDEFLSAIDRLNALTGNVFVAPFDVTDLDVHDTQLTRIESALGPLTTLVNNAGIGAMKRGDLLNVSEDSFDRCIAVNTKAPFFLSQTFSRRLLARERDDTLTHSIINVSSANATAVALQRGEYCASKAALAMISRTFAVRLGAENIAVYDVQPGLIETDMTAPVIDQYKKAARDGLTLLPRVGQPCDVGNIIATLATGRLPYTTGQVISADAGMLVSRF